MKYYCISTKGLLDRELTLHKGYYNTRQVYDQISLVNNFGYEEWYNIDRFVTVDPKQTDIDDSDMKIWKEN